MKGSDMEIRIRAKLDEDSVAEVRAQLAALRDEAANVGCSPRPTSGAVLVLGNPPSSVVVGGMEYRLIDVSTQTSSPLYIWGECLGRYPR